MTQHLTAEELCALARHQLKGRARAESLEHLEDCPKCQEAYRETSRKELLEKFKEDEE